MDIRILNRLIYKIGKFLSKKEVSASGLRQSSRLHFFIRPDHRGRYKFACEVIKSHYGVTQKVVDAACGTGYGSHYLAKFARCYYGFDIDGVAVSEAKYKWGNENCKFSKADLIKKGVLGEKVPVIVSFETLEHVSEPSKLLDNFYSALIPNGLLIISVPNQEVMPFSKSEFPHHFFHFTPRELKQSLQRSGFSNIQLYSQPDRLLERVENNSKGLYLIATATRK